MKLKKLFAGVVAAAMMATMAMPSFAAKHTYNEGTLEDHDSITVTKVYSLVGTGSSPDETFTLEQVGDGVVKKGGATTAPALGTITGAHFEVGDATANGTSKDITITLPNNFTTPGIYEYTLKEVVGTNAGVAYRAESKPIKLVVTVVSDDAGNLYRYAAVHTEESGDKSDEFTDNTYSANALTVKKEVKGNGADRSKYFDFTIKLTGEQGKTYAEKYTITAGSGVDTTKSATSISVDGDAVHVWLQNNGTVTIANLPAGVRWKVTEVGAALDAESSKVMNGEYEVTVPADANGTVSVAENADNDVVFTNKSTVNVDTGVILDNAPYILMLAVVAGAAMTLVIKKRREEE